MNTNKKKVTKNVYYEPEDDVLNIWFSKKDIDYAEETDGAIVHYTSDREPVYIEILFASRLLKGLKTSPKNAKEKISVGV